MKKQNIPIFLALVLLLSACSKQKSTSTSWNFNDPANGGFEFVRQEQLLGPGLIFIEGGRFTMGMAPQAGTLDFDQNIRNVSVPSFYLDQTEVTNESYREYLYWVYRVFEQSNPAIYDAELPDTNVWRS